MRAVDQFTYKGRNIRTIPGLLLSSPQVRKAWNEMIQILKANNCQPRLQSSELLSQY